MTEVTRQVDGLPAVAGLTYRHVDVFADAPLSGNGLVVVFGETFDQPAEHLRRVTAEMRQFETIFVAPADVDTRVDARIFTVEEELPFAGHPVLGAAAALHERLRADALRVDWTFLIAGRAIPVISERDGHYYTATMDQGVPSLSPPLSAEVRARAARALGLTDAHVLDMPFQVVSTGLPYLIVPVTGEGLMRAGIVGASFEAFLDELGAKFVYVLDPVTAEGRTWDNAGVVEDIATGSAAGPAAAYLLEHGVGALETPVRIRQGRFVGRPSSITVGRDDAGHLWVGGPVRPVATGVFDRPGGSVPVGRVSDL